MPMFRSFFLRCYRSFSRNMIVSLLPLAMPIIFLFLFLDATGDAGSAPTFRVGVAQTEISSPLVDSLMETGVVRISTIEDGSSPDTIDGRKHDAVLLPNEDSNTPLLLVREGFTQWANLLFSNMDRAPEAINSSDVIAVKEIEAQTNDYLSFILPGLFVMVLIQLTITSTANIVLGDRADGTFRMVASVRGAMVPLISAEILFRLGFAALCYTFMMVVISMATDGWIDDSLIQFTAVFILGATMMIAFGYTLGGILPGRRNWSAVITLCGLAFWFFSDILFQASQHALARPISVMLPPTYLTDALRQIATGRPGTFPLYVDIAVMILVLVACSAISYRFFRFDTNDDRM